MGGAGFEVETGDMDLLHQLFERQKGHLTAIKDYVSGHCTTPGGFGVVLQPLEPHYTSAYHSGVTGFQGGVTVAGVCSTKIVETKTSLIETDRKQYERYARHEAAVGHPVAAYVPPKGGGSLGPAATGAPKPGAEAGDPFAINAEMKWAAEHGYDAADAAVSAGYHPTHAAPATPAAGDGAPDGAGAAPTPTSGEPTADGSGAGSGEHTPAHGSHAVQPHEPEHENTDPNAAGQVVEIVNAPGDVVSTYDDVSQTVTTTNEVAGAANGPENDGQTTWANSTSGGTW